MKMSGWIVLGGILAGTATAARAGTFLDMHRGSDSLGNDYSVTSTPDEGICADLCNQDGKCVAMEFNNKTNNCYRKQSLGAISPSQDGVLGLKTIDLFNSQDYNGGDYRSFETGDAYSCSQQCVQEAACVAFTFNVETKLCWLKSAIVRQVANPYGIAGIK
jgi:hypothetical protein